MNSFSSGSGNYQDFYLAYGEGDQLNRGFESVFQNSAQMGGSSLDAVLAQAVQRSHAAMVEFWQREDAAAQMAVAFGPNYDVAAAGQFFESLGMSPNVLPIEVLDDSILGGARGAYAQATDTVYLSRQLLASGNVDAVTGVLLEEIGHGIDARVNAIDAPGDEGYILASQVQKEVISQDAMDKLKAEDDSFQRLINGELVELEFSAPSFDKHSINLGNVPDSSGWKVTSTGDFDGDGDSDILWRNFITGETHVWEIDGATMLPTRSVILGDVPDSSGWKATDTGDFDGDGDDDILWRNLRTGETHLWEINAATMLPTRSVVLEVVPDSSGWKVSETADFDGDGDDDVLWRNFKTGATAIWDITATAQYDEGSVGRFNLNVRSGTGTQYGTVGPRLSAGSSIKVDGWTIGDSYRGPNGETSNIWYRMHGTRHWVGAAYVNDVAQSSLPRISLSSSPNNEPTKFTQRAINLGEVPDSSGWRVVGTGDFNGDNDDDVLWRNFNTGETHVWDIDAATMFPKRSVVLGDVPDSSGWKATDTGDFDGDGDDDILWRNVNTGETHLWEIDAATMLPTRSIVLEVVPEASGWLVAGVGNFDGNQDDDVIWRNLNTGETAVWDITTVSQPSYYAKLSTLSDSDWDQYSGHSGQFGDYAISYRGVQDRRDTLPEIQSIFKDLSTAILGRASTMTAGYAYDATYIAGVPLLGRTGWSHSGIDFDTYPGENSKSVVNGRIQSVQFVTGAGYAIGIDELDSSQQFTGRRWWYLHIDGPGGWQVGDSVQAGDVIGTSDRDGHLHLTVQNENFGKDGFYNQTSIASVTSTTMSPLQAFWELKNQGSDSPVNSGIGTTSTPASLSDALAFTLKWEGGYVNNPNDPGGATNKGITQRTYNSYRQSLGLPINNVLNISDTEVHKIYERDYWLSSGSNDLSNKLATAHFDATVNHGPRNSRQMLSEAQAGGGSEADIVERYINIRRQFYQGIVARKPSQKVFLKGWLNRMNDLQNYLLA